MNKNHIIFDLIVLFAILSAIALFCRLWIFVLLFLAAIVIAVILLFLIAVKRHHVSSHTDPETPKSFEATPDEFCIISARVDELVSDQFPNAKWVWEQSNVLRRIKEGMPVSIVMNNAGGYRRANVIVEEGSVKDIEPVESISQSLPQEDVDKKPLPPNYDLLAYEWVDSHIFSLNETCNEAIGQGLKEVLIGAGELPVRESWESICRQLFRNDVRNAECCSNGIKINLVHESTKEN